MREALLIFAKNLVYGEVKTRLAATVGNDKAFAVYQQLLQHTAAITCNLPVDKLLFYSHFIGQEDGWSNCFQKHLQNGGDLGERIGHAFVTAFEKGYEKVVIIGTDTPALNAGMLLEAFQQLERKDVVIGPAEDGGYYLLGVKKNHPALFQNIAWSTATVFQETMNRINEMRLSCHLLPTLSDVDRESDLHAMSRMSTRI